MIFTNKEWTKFIVLEILWGMDLSLMRSSSLFSKTISPPFWAVGTKASAWSTKTVVANLLRKRMQSTDMRLSSGHDPESRLQTGNS